MIAGFIPPTAICRHGKDDPNCSSNRDRYIAYEKPARTSSLKPVETPDASNFEVEDIVEVGPHLVLKVRYPNCAKCSFEGNKVLVFLNVSAKDAIKWRTIDPHFRAPGAAGGKAAPGPRGRFPADPQGWQDAIDYAKFKSEQRKGQK